MVWNKGKNDGPPDLDELWKDFNRKLSDLMSGKKTGGGRAQPQRPEPDDSGSGGGGGGQGGGTSGGGMPMPDARMAGRIGVIVVLAAVLLWLASGLFIVQEGSRAVVTTFGQYSKTVGAGLNWILPWPVQRREIVPFTQLRSVEIGRQQVMQSTGLEDSSMLTMDENIVDIRFTVQYRLSDAREYIYNNRDADGAVVQAAESAVREIVGRSKVDSVLYEERDAIAAGLVKSVQDQLNRLKAGILITNVNVQNVQVPRQVQAAFNDAVKAGADRDRLKNEGMAYASDVIPRAQGTAARLKEEASGYASRVVAQAEGDSSRFTAVLDEYKKAPRVTRDRMYTDAMRTVYSNVTKVMVDSKSGSNLLYLPLDKILAQNQAEANAAARAATSTPGAAASTPAAMPGSPAAAAAPAAAAPQVQPPQMLRPDDDAAPRSGAR
ncbi:FtsH protease activity modulator HflK [Comamonadaceae bacterium SL12-8]|uniref:FtsH protease activity modulator HflK n=1 Tax=Amphibiibacter pelophylacis TaxID=1799477 RepID=A0ACC6P2M6_9BURK